MALPNTTCTACKPASPARPNPAPAHPQWARLLLQRPWRGLLPALLLILFVWPQAQARLPAINTTLASCSWDQPGAQAFTGDLVAAVDRYTDIPAAARKALKARMALRQYDDMAVIRRDSVQGKALYSPELRDMHFAQGRVCRTVSRQAWPASAVERGLVYCEGEHCLIVPTVCRNLSRVTRLRTSADASPAGGLGREAGLPGQARLENAHLASAHAPAADNDELQFAPPGAGRSFTQAAAVPAAPSSDAVLGGGLGMGADSSPLIEAQVGSSFEMAGAPDTAPAGTGPDTTGGRPGWPAFGAEWRPGHGGGNVFVAPIVVDLPTAVVPEPSTWLLMLGGLVVMVIRSRRV